MGDNHGAAAVPAFPVALCVLLVSYLTLLLLPFAYFLGVLACLYVVKLSSAYVLLTLVIKLTQKLLNILIIQKSYTLRQFSTVGFDVALKPSPFIGAHFKRWQNKILLWLTTMGMQGVAAATPMGPLTPDHEKAFKDASALFVGSVLSVLGDNLVDAYLYI
jgi:hypothetical protein